MRAGAPLLSQYWTLTKPRVVALIVFTAIIGMLLAIEPGQAWPWRRLIAGGFGIWLAAASAAAINHLLDQRIDKAFEGGFRASRQHESVRDEQARDAREELLLDLGRAGVGLLLLREGP